MNFKDIYKSANDKITGNRELLNKVFTSQRKVRNYRFLGFCTACAAAIVIFVCAFSIGIYSPDTKKTPRVLHVTPTEVSETDSLQNEKSSKLSNETQETSTPAKSNVFSNPSEYVSQKDTLPKEMPVSIYNDNAKNSTCTRKLSKKEYIEYLGIGNVIDGLTLPEGFAFNEPDGYIITTDASGKNIIEDSVCLDATYMDRFPVKIIAGKQNPPQKTGAITKRYGTTDINIVQLPNEIYVSLAYGDVWLDVTFFNISYDDLNILLTGIFGDKNLN